MSKLFSVYLNEKSKQENLNTILLFKSGIFYIALDKDAFLLASNLGLKLTNLNDNIKKCGFPISASDKYFKLIKLLAPFKIIDISNYQSFKPSDYKTREKTLDLLLTISKIDTDNIAISEAYNLLDNFKNEAINILNFSKGVY